MLLKIIGLCVLLQGGPSQAASAQAATALSTSTPPASSASGKSVRLTAGTQLEVELATPLSSATSHLGDKFALRLAESLTNNGIEIVAAGAPGEGEVIDAARAGMGGKAGKLILAARRLDLNGRPVRIRGLTLLTSGQSRVGLATAVMLVPYIGVTAPLIKGGEVEIPAGARYAVKLAEDVDLQSSPPKSIESEVK